MKNIKMTDKTIKLNLANTYINEDVIIEAPDGAGTGGGSEGQPGDGYKVRYLDADGTVLKTEYVEEGGKLTPPSNPTYDSEYLEFDTWNYDIDNYVVERNTDVGATYRTKTGDSYFFIRLTENIGLEIPTLQISGATSIDWGDGTVDSNLTHTYADYGDYVIKISGMTSITNYLFGDTTSVYTYCLQKCYLGNSVTFISHVVFSKCRSLKNVSISYSVTSIGSSAFNDCNSLTGIVIPNSAIYIYDSTFKYCYSLINVSIPENITTIGSGAFHSCYSLTSIAIPNGVRSIQSYAFYYCYSLTSINIPNSVASIGDSAFYYCYSLTSINIPNNVARIDNSTFKYCYSLASISIPNSVTEIYSNAFAACYSLASITIPNSVKKIELFTFNNCTSLTNYILNCNSVPTLSNTNAFDSINKSAIIWVKDELVEDYKSATNWSTYATYIKPISSMPEKLKQELGVL